MVRHFYLQRRRLASIGVLAFVAGYLLYSHVDATAMGMPMPVYVGLLYLVSVIVTASISIYYFPSLFRLIDCIAITRLVFAISIVGTESYEIAASPLACATIVVGGAIILSRVSAWFETLGLPITAGATQPSVSGRIRAFLFWLDNTAEREANYDNQLTPANAS